MKHPLPPRLLPVLGLLLAGFAHADNPDRPAGGSIAYVLTNMSWAMQSTPGAAECPKGLNEGTREQFKQLFPDNGTKRSFESTQLRREIDIPNMYFLAKPFSVAQICSAVEDVLKGR